MQNENKRALVIDLSPITLDIIHSNDVDLKFKNLLYLEPKLDETKQLYCVTFPELNINVNEYTREDLENALSEQIVFLWNEYVKEVDDNLTEKAISLKNQLLNFIEEAK